MATKKVVNKKAVEFPLDQIGYDTVSTYISNIEELAKVLEKAVYSKDSFEKFRKRFFEAYETVRGRLIVWRDRLGNVLPSEAYNSKEPAPNSWVAVAKEKGVSRLPLPRNEYDDKLDKVKQDEKDGVWRTYYGYWGTTDEEMEEIVNKVDPDYIEPKSPVSELELAQKDIKIEELVDSINAKDEYIDTLVKIIKTPWYKKLWNWVRRAN